MFFTTFSNSGGTSNIFGGSILFNILRIGKQVSLVFNTTTTPSTTTTGIIISDTALPNRFRPQFNLYFIQRVIKQPGQINSGLFLIRTTGFMDIYSDVTEATFPPAITGYGFSAGSINYNIV